MLSANLITEFFFFFFFLQRKISSYSAYDMTPELDTCMCFLNQRQTNGDQRQTNARGMATVAARGGDETTEGTGSHRSSHQVRSRTYRAVLLWSYGV